MIIIAGLPGTGKTLAASVFKSFGYETSVQDQSVVSAACRDVTKQICPGEYPYYVPFKERSFRVEWPWAKPPGEVSIVAFMGALHPMLLMYRAELVVVCQRSYDGFRAQVQAAEPKRWETMDIRGAYDSINLLVAFLDRVGLPWLHFNVDTMEWGPLTVPHSIGHTLVAKRLKKLLEEHGEGWFGELGEKAQEA